MHVQITVFYHNFTFRCIIIVVAVAIPIPLYFGFGTSMYACSKLCCGVLVSACLLIPVVLSAYCAIFLFPSNTKVALIVFDRSMLCESTKLLRKLKVL